ncbi:NUDIX hydrolase [Zhaonella formicivorans]|uniref:NUDIX hydrolase n=1 Tax=Zhaonella formicivorans TaxID=2528593 RepID=UPI0010EC6519|nr:NUDIX hydrolase [Zhaonella formicivorans]
MLFRNCAGGIVFNGDSVFILQNEKHEWVLPKGVIRNGAHASEVALKRVLEEGGINAKIIAPAGETSYEFYSYSRQQPVCNKITWFVMDTDQTDYRVNCEEGFLDGGFYPIQEAIEKITYSQDKSLVRVAYRKIAKILEMEKGA